MAGLLEGLAKLGLKNLEGMDLYEEEKKKEKVAEEQRNTVPVFQETDFLFDKTYECPVCDNKIKARTMKAGKAKLLRTDLDLRAVYEHIEPIKYEVIVCPCCGYAVLVRYFAGLTAGQIKAIKEMISKSYQAVDDHKETYTYEEALERYRLCLANAIVKHAKSSEKAYICLKAGWLLRAMGEDLNKEDADYSQKLEQLKEREKEFLKNALDGFLTARQSETYPICGMDETTIEYLIAVLAMEFEQYDVSSRIISSILTSPSAAPRIKDKARDVKDILVARIKEKNGH